MSAPELAGEVAPVAGATRGADRAIAVELARAGATVYATGRSSRVDGRPEIDRPETIEETGELIAAVALTPGWLRSENMLETFGVTEANWRDALEQVQLAQRYGFTDIDGSRPDCWRYLVEVQDPDLPANTDGYR